MASKNHPESIASDAACGVDWTSAATRCEDRRRARPEPDRAKRRAARLWRASQSASHEL